MGRWVFLGSLLMVGCAAEAAVPWSFNGPAQVGVQAGVESVEVSWTALEGATRYDVIVDGVRVETDVSSPFVVASLTGDTEYTFQVAAIVADQPRLSVLVTATPLVAGVGSFLPSAQPNWLVEANEAGAQLGGDLSSAGDVNGDGFDDILIGAYAWAGEGRAFVHYGGPTGVSAVADWTPQTPAGAGNFGGSVAALGDVNNDGYAEIAIGGPASDAGAIVDAGRGQVYFGTPTGLETVAGFERTGANTNDGMGWPVKGGGDLNGDGYLDLFMGCVRCDNADMALNDTGMAHIFYGNDSGFDPTPWTFQETVAGSRMPYRAVSIAGDVNDDGYDDLLIASRFHNSVGRGCVFLGSSTGVAATPVWVNDGLAGSTEFGTDAALGDFNGDGYSDVAISEQSFADGEAGEGHVWIYYGSTSGPAAVPQWTGQPDIAGARYGTSIATLDTNGDGYDDLLVGASGVDNNTGRTYLYLGTSEGLEAAPVWQTDGEQAGSQFGNFVENAGDVNGDGHDDLLIAASQYADGQTQEGKAYVYLAPPGKGPRVNIGEIATTQVGAPVALDKASFIDPRWEQAHECTWTWGDGDVTTQACTLADVAETTHTYLVPGRYLVTLRITNALGVAGEATGVVDISY